MKATASHVRRVPRRAFTAGVGVLYQGHYSVGKSLEVGEGGIALQSEFAFRQNDKVILTFQIPSGSLICTRATVIYNKAGEKGGPASTGFEFDSLNFHFKRELRNFVARGTQENF